MSRPCLTLTLALALLTAPAPAAELHVAPAGNDGNPGTRAAPLATPAAAQKAARTRAGREPVTVLVHEGTYYLSDPLRFGPEDSGTAGAPVTYAAAPGARVVLSGGRRLDLSWQPSQGGILQAKTPPGLTFDQMFINGARQTLARYPNLDPRQRILGGYAADAFAPARAARWADPAGGFIHALHSAHWGGYHYRITGKKPDNTVTYEGGWQNNRQMGMHREHRYVENIREELDAPGEWFHDARSATFFFSPPPGLDLARATVEVARLPHLVEVTGTRDRPVRFLTLRGFTLRHAARTFMDTREPLLRSDWTIYRGGAALVRGAEDVTLADCEFDQVGGNAVFLDGYNRRVAVRGCHIHDTGASGVCLVGQPRAVRNPLFEYGQRQTFEAIDRDPGPATDDYPADCLVDDCLITRTGRVEKQSAGVQISMAKGITVRHCSIYEVPRAGINVSEGTWGGHLIEFCDVFDTVLETGDHGSFNSWGRDRYWGLEGAPATELRRLAKLDAVATTVLRHSRWRCDHGWDIDLDDGSSNYEITGNLLLKGGLKLREGFDRVATGNVIVHNSLHPHVWYADSADVFARNIVMGPYRPAGGMPPGKWGQEIDFNLFTTSDADRTKFAAHGCDAHSRVGAAQFVDPAHGDYRVRDDSPALALGFQNFPVDRFGVQKPDLKKLARTPELPGTAPTREPASQRDPKPVSWRGATIKNVVGLGEVSAAGLPGETGVLLVKVSPASDAARAGLREGDVILKCGRTDTATLADLLRAAKAVGRLRLEVWRGQMRTTVELPEEPSRP